MKKALFICGFLMLVMSSFSQKEVEFFLQSNGSFLTADGSDYVVVPFEGKTSSELYSMVKSNAMTFYRDPKEVMSEDENVAIKICALKNLDWGIDILSNYDYYGYYNFLFQFKDGKIRIDAPSISKEVYNRIGKSYDSFYYYVRKLFTRKGAVKQRKLKHKLRIEDSINYPINYLLGFYQKNTDKDNNW